MYCTAVQSATSGELFDNKSQQDNYSQIIVNGKWYADWHM